MMVSNRRICFLIIFFLPVFCAGQDTIWTLDACIQYAWENNFDIKQYSLLKEKADLQVKSANNLFLPSVEGRLRNNYNWGLFIDPATNILTTRNSEIQSGMIEAEWVLFNGGYNYHAVRQNRELYQSAVMDEKTRKNEATLLVMAVYFQYLYSIEQLKITTKRKQQLDRQYKQIKGMVERGVLHRREVLNVESQVALNDVTITEASNSIRKSNLMLRQAMGLMEPVDLKIAPAENASIPDSLALTPYDSLSITAGRNMPETISALHKLNARMHTLRMAKALRYPSFSIVTGAVTKSSNLIQLEQSEQFRRNLTEYVVFNLTLPIFTRFENVNRISSAQLDVVIQENQVKKVNQEVEKRIQAVYLDMLTAHQTYQAVYKQSKSLEAQNHYAEESYLAGIINFTEYNYINSLYLNNQLQLIQAKYNYLYQKQLLEFYKGSLYFQK